MKNGGKGSCKFDVNMAFFDKLLEYECITSTYLTKSFFIPTVI